VTLPRRFALASLAALGHLGWPALAHALDPARVITQYGHDVWQIEEGLPHGTVRAFEQTRDGYLW